MKVPSKWSDFKIVETQEGCFTGQIFQADGFNFSEKDRKELVDLTRLFLEEKTGMKIGKFKYD